MNEDNTSNNTFIWNLNVEEDPIKFGFNSTLINQNLISGVTQNYALPTIINPNGDKYSTQVILGSTQIFTTFDNN